jgi:pimeloyl-ACP methyl ester carboxylesterase
MATFVLVHGAMHGGWCWRDVRRSLQASGHDVFTPTLTGQGDRAHLLTRDVGIETHVEDLSSLLEFEDLADVHLVLHSYSGVLAGPVAQASHGRLATVTYLGAFIANDGESVLDVEPPEVAARYMTLASEEGGGWKIPADGSFLAQWGLVEPDLVAWVEPRLTDFPLRCATDPVHFDARHLEALPQAYLRHVQPLMESLELSYQRAVARGMQLVDLETSHDAMIEDANLVARTLLEVTGQPS